MQWTWNPSEGRTSGWQWILSGLWKSCWGNPDRTGHGETKVREVSTGCGCTGAPSLFAGKSAAHWDPLGPETWWPVMEGQARAAKGASMSKGHRKLAAGKQSQGVWDEGTQTQKEQVSKSVSGATCCISVVAGPETVSSDPRAQGDSLGSAGTGDTLAAETKMPQRRWNNASVHWSAELLRWGTAMVRLVMVRMMLTCEGSGDVGFLFPNHKSAKSEAWGGKKNNLWAYGDERGGSHGNRWASANQTGCWQISLIWKISE